MPTLNRSIALKIVPLLAWLRMTPNQVTLLGLAAGMVAAVRFGGGSSSWLVGALWLQLSFILDNCDGTLARQQNRTSGFGSWLDTVSDCAVNIGLFYGIGAGLQRDTGQYIWLVGGLVTAVGVFFSYAMAFALQVHRRGIDAWRHPDPPAGAEPDSRLVGFRKRARGLLLDRAGRSVGAPPGMAAVVWARQLVRDRARQSPRDPAHARRRGCRPERRLAVPDLSPRVTAG